MESKKLCRGYVKNRYPAEQRICIGCQKDMTYTKSGNINSGFSSYCSVKCERDIFNKKLLEKIKFTAEEKRRLKELKESENPPVKRIRFDVLARDMFTCQYCGRKAPDVILQVDHKFPACCGGKYEIENLLTSCKDCNIGKGGRIFEF